LLKQAEQNLLQVDRQCDEFRAASDSISDLIESKITRPEAGIVALDALKNRLMGLTYNNLGCLCKQQKDFPGALVYLKRALDFESRLEDMTDVGDETEICQEGTDSQAEAFSKDLRTTQCNSAGTILNICAILSKMNKHNQAQEYASEAVLKLRHSMRLTKEQAVYMQARIAFAKDTLLHLSEEEHAAVDQAHCELSECEK